MLRHPSDSIFQRSAPAGAKRNSMRHSSRFALQGSALVLALAAAGYSSALLAQTAAASSFKPEVLVRFTGNTGAAVGATPIAPPVLGKDGRLHGTTKLGGPTLGFIITQGVAYSLPTQAADTQGFSSVLMGNLGSGSSTLVQDGQGTVYGGVSFSNHNNTGNALLGLPVMFSIAQGTPAAWTQPDLNDTYQKAISPRGQMAIDDDGKVYLGSGEASSICGATTVQNQLWRITPAGVFERVIDFCRFTNGDTGTAQLQYKGGVPMAQVWSQRDQALYAMTSVTARGVFDPTATDDYLGRAVGTLVKIGKAALDEGAAANGVLATEKIELLHTFLRGRDGEPVATSERLSGLVEAGDWLYGTTFSNNPTSSTTPSSESYSGTVWRVKKNDPSTFKVVHAFRGAGTLAADGTPEADAGTPYGPIVFAADGNIYGTTKRDGTSMHRPTTGEPTPVGAGALFRIRVGTAADRSDDVYEVLHRFDAGTEGARPVGLSAGAVSGGIQKLYGATANGGAGEVLDTASSSGGATGNGTVFSFDVPVSDVKFTVPLSASATTVRAGDTVQLSWDAANAASCTAGGSNGGAWLGAQQTSGSQVPVVLRTAGNNTLALTCASGSGGAPATSSVSVTVTAANTDTATPGASGGGTTVTGISPGAGRSEGGGPLSAWLLAPLAALAAWRGLRRSAR